MTNQLLRMIGVIGALAWLNAFPSVVKAQSAACDCWGTYDSWAYVLPDPHCSSTPFHYTDYSFNNSIACNNWCANIVENAAPAVACNAICYNGSGPANQWSYDANVQWSGSPFYFRPFSHSNTYCS